MKLKRLLINALLIGGLSLTSCATYSTRDIQEIYNYIQEKGLDISNWVGLNFQYTFKSSSETDKEESKMSVKVSHYKGEYRALITSKTKYSYTWGSYSDSGTIYMDLYSESDWSILRMKGKENGNGTKISFSASYKDKYKINRYGELTSYTDKEKYTISLNYDENYYVSSFSYSISSSSKSSDSKESGKLTLSATPYNKKISTPSWAK